MRPNASYVPRLFPGAPRRKRPRIREMLADTLPLLAGIGLGSFFVGIITGIAELGLEGRVFLVSAAAALVIPAALGLQFVLLHLFWRLFATEREEERATPDPVVEQLIRDLRRVMDESPLNPDRRNNPR